MSVIQPILEKTFLLTPDDLERDNLVVAPKGTMLAYNVNLTNKNAERIIDGAIQNEVAQIFTLPLNDDYLKQLLN